LALARRLSSLREALLFFFLLLSLAALLVPQPLALELGRVVFVEVEGGRGVDERGHGSASTAFGSLQGSLQASIF
jgi:hypothetical protein